MPRYPATTVIMAVLLLMPQLYLAGVWVHRQLGTTLADLDFPRTFVSHTAYISRDHLDGDSLIEPRGVLIVAPQRVEPASLIPPERRTRYFER